MAIQILLTGKDGQLGNEIQQLAATYPAYEFIFTDKPQLDITSREAVQKFFAEHNFAFCINAAAYTAVDKAEQDKDVAMLVNATAVANLAEACSQYTCRFIHVSTDYVFNGKASTPYKETDTTDPVNYYGLTKLEGEKQALKFDPATIIIRTSWVYSTFGNNFVKTMLRLMQERESLNVVSDQFGSPTYARDLAEAIMEIINDHVRTSDAKGGIYHFSNEGNINWYDFAVAIKEISASKCVVNPIPTANYPTPASRPSYSVFNKTRIAQRYSIQLKDWRESLQAFFVKLQQS